MLQPASDDNRALQAAGAGPVGGKDARPLGHESARARSAGAFKTPAAARTYWLILAGLLVISLLAAFGLLAYSNPFDTGTPKWWLIAERRSNALIAMAVAAVCHAVATVAFQTVTNNRILTPGILGFQALYTAIHTSTVYFAGAAGLVAARTLDTFIFQLVMMVALSLLLYSWLLTGKRANMHVMLLVGVVLGGGLGSLSTFMQRMLTPSEFDILTARLFASVNNADPEYYPIAIPLVAVSVLVLYLKSRTLNTLSLGEPVATNLGVNHRRETILVLVLVSVMMAVSTALVGPLTFLGFLVATLTYQFADTYDHRYLFPMATVLSFAVLAAAYFIMNHIFAAQGVVGIIIELVGGLTFLIVILRKGKL
ncbi:iron chelate uptake ABC transporter family permease subunit [Rothia nasimurium]|uniref:iron chelate uptake ABC transporter family permease subunit n=1 Tax=Rothia nasimurium TaxID=85336 RepID=UPI0015D67A18|nr:iron chelate uptake ABC transporter family permease subunit [Rothia nasimurium]